PNISRHELTTAMQHLCTSPEGLPYFYDIPVHVKPRKGSSRRVELNHTLRCLCGPPSIPLSFSLAAVLPRRQTPAFAAAPRGSIPPAPGLHRLGRGLPEYLIPFAPHAFASQR